MKKIFAGTVLGLSLTLASTVGASASTIENENVGVSTQIPVVNTDSGSTGGVTVFSIAKPSKDSVKNLNDGKLSFAGSAGESTLYTNSHFKGKSKISYSITNSSATKLTVKIIKSGSLIATKTLTIEPKSTLTGTVDKLNKDSLYYMSFKAPSSYSFSGYVK